MSSKQNWIEKVAVEMGLVPRQKKSLPPSRYGEDLQDYPPFDRWLEVEELDASRRARRMAMIPTTCFNCEAGCGLLATIDVDEEKIVRIEGNPLHPGSRGRNCAKGPATLNQINDPDRILQPMVRKGARGEGGFEPISWDEALDTIAEKIRGLLQQERHDEVMYHVGRPGHEGSMERVLQAWGVDGHNSHTTVCSASARCGYQLTWGYDRPAPDHENAQLILLISAHLESGHYFNPHAQRIIEAKQRGARIVVLDPRLSNTAAKADLWLATRPGTEGAVLLAVLRLLIVERKIDLEFVENWIDWRGYMQELHPSDSPTLTRFLERFAEHLEEWTPEMAEELSGIEAGSIQTLAAEIERAGPRMACHIWRSAASGNLGGWQIARSLALLTAFTGALGQEGGTSPAGWNKLKPAFFSNPEHGKRWNELIWPRQYPTSFYEMSHLLPHLVEDGVGKIGVYFTRVFNPVWTFPDGMSWMRMLRDEDKVGLHIAMTPTWNETALFADLVLPMGHSTERHDVQSQETHNSRWISFRQPVLRTLARLQGKTCEDTREFNPGEVWEEDEFWIELSWRIDPDGALGIRKHFESPYRTGEKITVEEQYRYMFENDIPGLPEKAAEMGMDPFEYMSRVGAFELPQGTLRLHEKRVEVAEGSSVVVDPITSVATIDGKVVGVAVDGAIREGFPTRSRRVEVFSNLLKEWGFADMALPAAPMSHVGPDHLDPDSGTFVLVPTFRLPTMIHSRSANSKHLTEISHANPVWIHPDDADHHGIEDGSLVRIETEIGHFVNRARVTDGLRPGVLACSHHMGRWKPESASEMRWSCATVRFEDLPDGRIRMRQVLGAESYVSEDPDSERTWWQESGVHQNMAFGVQTDPVSGMHCWHQKVRLARADATDQYADVVVDTAKSREVHRRWLALARPASPEQHGGLRRPPELPRPLARDPEAYYFEQSQ
ncbi:MAG: formate dehydrogenase [Planctomycetota bacterium]|nr:MAG: formate dehydrogenase [Planctomycetota bacterium]